MSIINPDINGLAPPCPICGRIQTAVYKDLYAFGEQCPTRVFVRYKCLRDHSRSRPFPAPDEYYHDGQES